MQASMDKRIRMPYYGSISLFIETLTGTYFKLHVNPSETILAIKAKIQRLEGIPISQQHLIWEGSELDDKMCLHDYRIPRDASIKLVTALRGGPINTRKITTNDTSDYFDLSEEELFEEFPFPPPSNDPDSQVTLLVLRNGDQINFFRVMDCGGGKITPSSGQLRRQNSDSKPPSGVAKSRVTMSRIKENQITAEKMKKLQNKIKLLRLKENATNESSQTKVKSSDGPSCSTTDDAKQDEKNFSDVDHCASAQTNVTNWRPSKSVTIDKISPQEGSPRISFNRHDKYLRSYGLLPNHLESASTDEDTLGVSLDERASAVPLSAGARHEFTEFHNNTSIGASPISRMSTLREGPHLRGPKTFVKKDRVSFGHGDTLGLRDIDDHTKLPSISTHTSMTSAFPNGNIISGRSSSRNAKPLDMPGTSKDFISRIPSASNGRAAYGEKSTLLLNSSRKHSTLQINCDDPLQIGTGDDLKLKSTTDGPVSYPANPPAPILPPVRPFVIKKKRCYLCGKKTGLASSYICRCGENFCASHRYAEVHGCTFDYKANGRQVLKEANPVISSRKLPKI